MRIDRFFRSLIAGTIALSGAIVPAIYTVAAAPVDLTLVPAGQSVHAGDIFEVIIQAQSGSQQVIGVDAYLDFDSTKLAVVDMNSEQTGIQISGGPALPVFLWNSANNTSGQIAYSAGAFNPYPCGTFTVATIRFQALAEKSQAATVTFSTSIDRPTLVVGGTCAAEVTGTLTGATYLIIAENTPAPSGGSSGGVDESVKTLKTNGLSTATALTINSNGVAQNTTRFITLDGRGALIIGAGTTLLASSSNPLTQLTAEVINFPPAAPTGNALILSYTFGPSGASFNPDIVLSLSYDPAKLPGNVLEADLFIAYFDGTNWVPLAGTVDTINTTVNAKISHFSIFALMSKVAAMKTSIPLDPLSDDTADIKQPQTTPADTDMVQISPILPASFVADTPEQITTEEQPPIYSIKSTLTIFIIVAIVLIGITGVIIVLRNYTNNKP